MLSTLLDTCVIVKLRGKKVREAVEKVLKTVLAKTNLYISEMSCYEFLRTAKNYEDYLAKHSFMTKWPHIKVDHDVLKIATLYYNLLSQFKKSGEKEQAIAMSRFSDADIIVGATAIQYDSYIVTTNGSDYPRPIFDEIRVMKLGAEKLYILKPDTRFFSNWIRNFCSAASS